MAFDLDTWKRRRQRCRVDLIYLCKVLGYMDVNPAVHGRIVANLQQFRGGTDTVEEKIVPGIKGIALPSAKAIVDGYTPACSMWDLEGPRNRLNMIPRGHLKTTVITFAHTIQWILNFPDIRILLSTHTDGMGKGFINEIRKHFTNSEDFRLLFPEHVPHGKAANEFGNQEGFDTCSRRVWRREKTVEFCTVGSSIAGKHFDVIKHDDIVDKENVRTPDQIQVVKDHLGMTGPLLETFAHPTRGNMKGWVDLTGTFYDHSDINVCIYESELEKPVEKRIWSLNVQSAAPNWPDPPYLWPDRVGYKALKEIEDDPAQGPAVLASQYLLDPTPKGSGLIDDESQIVWTPRAVLKELYARMTLNVTIDLAGMDVNAKRTADNDFTVLNLNGCGTDGHVYIYELLHAKPTPHQVIEHMFDLYQRHPRIQSFKVPKDHFTRVLLPFLKAEEIKRNVFLPIMEVPIDNQTSKKQKIKGLQPWFQRGMIHFADDLPCKQWIRWEIMKFPKYAHDDILDTVYDAFAGRDGRISSDIIPSERVHPSPTEKVLEVAAPDGTKQTVTVDVAAQQLLPPFLFGTEEHGAVDDVTGW